MILAAALSAPLSSAHAATAKSTAKKPAVLSPAAIAELKASAARYERCMATIDKNAQDAFDLADSWITLGGGEAAKHCAAAALLAQGLATDAAQRLEDLAKSSVQDDAFRADIYAQAGEAWTKAKNWDKANAVQSAAITLAPKNLVHWINRARTRALAENYGLAVDDLTHVLEKAPKNTEALILRASAYRFMDASDLAMDDINAALTIAPKNPEALLERGILYRLANQADKARHDWITALLLVEEKSETAQTIRRNIELLEFPEPAKAAQKTEAKN